MQTYSKRLTLDRLNTELSWRLDELRFTQDAARQLEVRKEIRLLEKQISLLENQGENREFAWRLRTIH